MSEPTGSLYAARVPIFPRRVTGTFRRLKWWILAITLGIYYITPWIRWDRGPERPDQAVLVDLANRRFWFFWVEIWSHEFYFVAGLLIMAGLGLFLFTSALGRVWCGYACPQTVWTDLFLLVERWVEGDRNARIRLHKAPWSARKARLRITKWLIWFAIAVATGGAWVFYFTDAPTLLGDLVTFSAPAVAYITIGILTATTFIFGGFMREQVCIYMCPWPRIQGAMMDEGTLTVGYRDWRGEPRGKGTKRRQTVAAEAIGGGEAEARYGLAVKGKSASESVQSPTVRQAADGTVLGDCIDCNACVAVCPMGIDIREGQQMECITCALCIDACDDVMEKIGKPRGLIDYLSLTDRPPTETGEAAAVRPMGTTTDWAPQPVWRHIFRPRTIVYFVLWAGFGLALLVLLFIRPDLEVTVAPVRNPTYVTLSDGTVRNAYDVRVRNKMGEVRPFRLDVTGAEDVALTIEGADADGLVFVEPDTQETLRVYVAAAPGTEVAEGHVTDLRIWVMDMLSDARASKPTTFNGLGG